MTDLQKMFAAYKFWGHHQGAATLARVYYYAAELGDLSAKVVSDYRKKHDEHKRAAEYWLIRFKSYSHINH